MPKISSRESANFTVFFTLTVLKQFHNMMCPPNMQHFWAVSLYRARRYSFRETQDYCLSEKRNFGFVWMISCIPEINRLMQNCFLKNSKLIFLCVFFNNVFFLSCNLKSLPVQCSPYRWVRHVHLFQRSSYLSAYTLHSISFDWSYLCLFS